MRSGGKYIIDKKTGAAVRVEWPGMPAKPSGKTKIAKPAKPAKQDKQTETGNE